MKRVMVTGANGFVTNQLVQKLLWEVFRVEAFVCGSDDSSQIFHRNLPRSFLTYCVRYCENEKNCVELQLHNKNGEVPPSTLFLCAAYFPYSFRKSLRCP